MSLLIRPCHHHAFRAVLRASSRLRREVFVDHLGRTQPDAGRVAETGLEYDEFGDEAAIHLVNLGPAGQVVGAVRITPSTAPNRSCDVLAPQMGVAMPRGPHIVEMPRLCAGPGLSREERRETMLELRACIGFLFQRNGWTHSVGVGYDRHIQPFIQSGMTVQVLGPPMLFAGDGELSFAILVTDPDRPQRVAEMLAGGPACLQDPDEDPSLFTRYGDRAVA